MPEIDADSGWFARPPNIHEPEDVWTLGRVVRIMVDECGGLPLWDEDGRLPEEPEYLYGFLGLSAGLVADLVEWAHRAERVEQSSRMGIVTDGKALRSRLQNELGPEHEVQLILPT